MKKRIILLLIIFNGVMAVKAQQSHVYTYEDSDFQKALQWYKDKQYRVARDMFGAIKLKTDNIDVEADCAYYMAACAIRLNQFGADDLMEDFTRDYPESAKRSIAFIHTADFYFENGKYTKALRWYNMAETKDMMPQNTERFNFRKGYALFVAKRYEEAETSLSKVTDTKRYASEATYYLGYIAYKANDYEKADTYFNAILNDPKLNKKLSYYQADMNFKLGNFQKAIDFGTKQLTIADRSELSQLHKIIGESYFNLQQYKEALPHLKKYRGQRGRWTHTDFYQLGYAYYKQGDYENAINQFNKIINGKDEIAQNAYYHLAECYLKTEKKQEALNAFRNASQMDFNAEIQQDAWLNYARLSYDIGNPYQSVPQVLLTYMEKYPDSGHKAEIKAYLVDAYITSKNYDEALDFLKKENSTDSNAAYQKVAFEYGLELFSDRKYPESLKYLKKSLQQPRDSIMNTRAIYWIAQADYLLNNYNNAIIGFKEFVQRNNAAQTPEYKDIDYHIAYTYFKQKTYDQAVPYFNTFIKDNKADAAKINDAYLRLGDLYFVKGTYDRAIKNYDNAIESRGANNDYAYFQKAMSYGYSNNKEKKAETLTTFLNSIPKSPLRDDALYELGNTYISLNKTESGLSAYKQLAESYKMSSFLPKALLKEGLIHYNTGKNNRALTSFKRIVNDFPNTQEALQAVETAKLIYIDINRVEEYASWVKSLDFVEVPNADLDNAAFEAAEKQFVQGNTDAAINSFERYVRQFPNGLHAVKANFYLAQSYFGKGEKTKTIPHYTYVINREQSEYTEQSLARLGQILMENESHTKALPILKRLEAEADRSQNVTFAQANLMKAHYERNDYKEAITYAEKVLGKKKVDKRIKSDARIIIARAAIKTGDEARAKKAYAQVRKTARGARAAEALYYDAYFKHKEKKYKSSNSAIQRLAKSYAPYKEFGGKGLLLMAKNFYALKDAFQATYILENIITNFTDYPEVVAEAQTTLRDIKAQEAKRNASIENEEN